jgi:hypothetical protein
VEESRSNAAAVIWVSVIGLGLLIAWLAGFPWGWF